MDENKKKEILNISKDTNCWVVRCHGGKYYQHFKQHSEIAIGHIDYMEFDKIDNFIDDTEATETEIRNYLINERKYDEKSAKKVANSDVNQAIRFITTILEDDYIITNGDNNILIGLIKDDAYFNKKSLIITKEHYKIINGKKEMVETEYKMDSTLRRKVEWIAEIPKVNAPYALQRLLIAPLTVFKIREPLTVFHSIYPMFTYNKKQLHFSIYIKQNEDIKNNDMLNLFGLLNDIEYICKNTDDLENKQSNLGQIHVNSNLNVKASFMSPGEVFAFLPVIEAGFDMTSFYMLYSFMFGSKHMGIDGVIPKEARVKIVEHYLESQKKPIEKLKLSSPNHSIKMKKKKKNES